MANEVKELYSSPATLTITLASLASSGVNVGRQSTLVDNSTTGYAKVQIYVKITLGTGPAANTAVYVHFIRGNGTVREDGAGATDAAFTIKNVALLGILNAGTGPSTGDVLEGIFTAVSPGPEWGIAVTHDTNVALDATGGNHSVSYVGINLEVQ